MTDRISKGAGNGLMLSRRELGPDLYNLYIWASDGVFQAICDHLKAMRAKYGDGEARQTFRMIVLEQRADGKRILAALDKQFTHLRPITADGERMLADIFDE